LNQDLGRLDDSRGSMLVDLRGLVRDDEVHRLDAHASKLTGREAHCAVALGAGTACSATGMKKSFG
jgi:hypothetical protein